VNQAGERAVIDPLDTPVWSALTTRQATLALGDGLARRLDPAYGPFAGTADHSAASLTALSALLSDDDTVALFTPLPFDVPPGLASPIRRPVIQMIATSLTPGVLGARHPTLPMRAIGAADVPAMTALVDLTKPGPFAARTHEMGRYLGIFDDDRLAAMAGERLLLDGFVEISAVCTDPAYRGRGLAGALVTTLSQAALDRGEIPFLHVFADNEAALRSYLKVGFVVRKPFQVTVLRRAETRISS
jgi:predicted GNAT family acetyltransferase